MHQGIFIDIFPLDSVPDGVSRSFTGVFEMERLLWNMVKDPAETLGRTETRIPGGEKDDPGLETLFRDLRTRGEIQIPAF